MQSPVKIARPPSRPVLIYDGACGFCCVWIRRWQQLTGDRIEYLPFQSESIPSRFPELRFEQLIEAVHLVQPDGSVFYGAEAGLRALHSGEKPSWLWRIYSASLAIASIAENAYHFVAAHRPLFSRLTRILWGNHVEPARHLIVQSIFIRSLGLIYLIAIISLWSQISGLIGSRGILPAQDTMEALRNHVDTARMGADRYRIFPTLCWFAASDRSLALQCAAGTVLAACVIFGMAPAPCLFLLWLIYLSLCTICREFLGFQWDNLLLEIGFLAIFLSPFWYLPWRVRKPPLLLTPNFSSVKPSPSDSLTVSTVSRVQTLTAPQKPSLLIIWLLRWLLFRLMWESGRVKILSLDTTWADYSALTFHYETQPLPTWIGWYAHQLPIWFQKSSCVLMFAIELVLPFFIFTPRRIRHWVGIIFVLFQAAIFLTGNYCFFNLLTIVLCFALFDDQVLRVAWSRVVGIPSRAFRRRSADVLVRSDVQTSTASECSRPNATSNAAPDEGICTPLRTVSFCLKLAVASLVLFLTIPQIFELSGARSRRPPLPSRNTFVSAQAWFAPFRTFDIYGLFAVMTRPRYEIIVQGSNDGQTWQDYEFKYKPGDTHRRPGFVAPHQPRLDWQMWFAALGSYRENPWFLQFCGRLLQGSPEVLSLLQTNPFPSAPPKYIRAMLYEYHFTDIPTRRATGEWWRRELKGEYLPVLSLRVAQTNP